MLCAVMKMKRIAAILLSFALLAFLPSGQACAAPKRYTDADHGFSFSYPETWQLHNMCFDTVMVFAPLADGITANVSIFVMEPFEEADMTLDEFIEYYAWLAGDAEMLSYRKTKLGGVPCVAVEAFCPNSKQKVRELVYYANYDEKGYVLAMRTYDEDYGKCVDSFKMILDSFKF